MRTGFHFWLPGLAVAVAAAAPADRAVESVVPALVYGSGCSSSVNLRNLADTPVSVQLEAHRASGALVALAGAAGQNVQLDSGQQASYRLEIEEDTDSAWVKIRELVPVSRSAPAVAVSGAIECHTGDQLQTAARDISYPTRNPWFSGDVSDLRGAVVTLINTSAEAAGAWVCYSAGNLFFVPGMQPSPELAPICSETANVQIPPFGTRQFPVEHGGNSHFSLRTRGQSIVLQMLRPGEGGVRIFKVDSSIQFGREVPDKGSPSQ